MKAKIDIFKSYFAYLADPSLVQDSYYYIFLSIHGIIMFVLFHFVYKKKGCARSN